MLKKRIHSKLWLYLTTIVFSIIMALFLVFLMIWYILYYSEIITIHPFKKHMPIIWFLIGSLLIGICLTYIIGQFILQPIEELSQAFQELSIGNFQTKIPTQHKIPEIEILFQNFNSMVNDLSHIETLRNDFIINVSHEFKTPLATIEGYATLIQNPHLSNHKRDQYAERIIANCTQLSSLSSNILALSKLETQEFIFHKKNIRLDEQIRKNILLLENKWEKKHIQFNIDLPIMDYFCDEQLLDRVWYNLIDNAIKYSHDYSTIEITIDDSDNDVSVSITDEGIGIQQDNLKYIFDKFYQVDHSRQSDGNGLGLSLVKEIIELCNGSIHVVSFPDIGSTFTVILPKNMG